MKILGFFIIFLSVRQMYSTFSAVYTPFPNILTTSFIRITLEKSENWVDDDRIVLSINSEKILALIPSINSEVISNQRIKNATLVARRLYINLNLERIEDGEKWLFLNISGTTIVNVPYLSVFVLTDLTPYPLLYWTPIDKLKRDSFTKKEGDTILIICRQLYGLPTEIVINIPQEMNPKMKDIQPYFRSVEVVLNTGTIDVEIECRVGGISVSSSKILNFEIDNHRIKEEKPKGGIIFYLFTLIVVLITPLGIYLLLFQQNSMYNNKKAKRLATIATKQMYLLNYRKKIGNKFIIFDEAGISRSKKFEKKLNKAKTFSYSTSKSDREMEKIEKIHQYAKIQSRLYD